MSLKAETFHAVKCDFPDCTALFEFGGEYTYTTDPYSDTDAMRENGWCISNEGDYCADHTTLEDCNFDLGEFCKFCGEEDRTIACYQPVPATPEGLLKVMVRNVTERAHRDLDHTLRNLERALGLTPWNKWIGGAGTLRGRTDIALNAIHHRACLAIQPDLTARQIAKLQKAAA